MGDLSISYDLSAFGVIFLNRRARELHLEMKGQQVDRISCVTPLMAALRAGITDYQPDLPGVPLERETGDLAVSSRNLQRLLAAGLALADASAGLAGILFRFCEGEEYLALGFGVGNETAASALGALLAREGFGTLREIRDTLSALRPAESAGHPPPHGSAGRC